MNGINKKKEKEESPIFKLLNLLVDLEKCVKEKCKIERKKVENSADMKTINNL